MAVLRSKHTHEKGVSGTPRGWGRKKSGSSILKYEPFVMDRHLVHALMESWVPESKAFRIGRREVLLLVYDMALLTGHPTTGKHVTFDHGEDPCEVENMSQTVCSFLAEAMEDTKEKIPLRRNLQMHGFAMILQIIPYLEVRDLEGREATVKAFNDTEDFNAYSIISIEKCLRRMREALRTTEALTLERVTHAATKKEPEHMRALLMGRGRGEQFPRGTQNEGLQCAGRDGEGSVHASDRRVSTSQGNDRYSFHTKFHNADMGSAEDAQERKPFGDTMLPEGENEMVAPPIRWRKMWSPHWSAT
ncbi:hypothetical protein Cgig2_011289 [Carnegiea gigantea]|uniref:Uncharacterized protein n=1 Tax=Carnegiea gigantea TaxID=171969 RepID=A0A9Q1GXP7_9CARY|nr:hypothetical protein Cgig2_011289 [Carnegiea gigantea]